MNNELKVNKELVLFENNKIRKKLIYGQFLKI